LLKELKRKFVINTMVIVTVLLTAMLLTISLFSYRGLINRSDRFFQNSIQEIEKDKMGNIPKDKEMSRLTVLFFEEDKNVDVYKGRDASFSSDEELIETANGIINKSKTTGFTGDFRYNVIKGNTTVVMLLDCSIELHSYKTFLVIGIIVFILAEILMFFIAIFMARSAIRPVVESYKKQKQFITNAGHELKTPLTVISTDNDIIEMENGKTEWTQSISTQVKRLYRMTQQLIDLAKIDERVSENTKTDINLSAMLEEAVMSFEPLFKKTGKKIETKITSTPSLKADIGQMEKLISILLDNALKYSKEGSTVKVFLYEKNRKAYLEIQNSVDKMKEGPHPELFERFYRGDESHSTKTSGTGLGLAIASEILQTEKSKITAECSKDNLFTITVKF